MQTTDGHLLGGRLRYTQPRDGYRTGIEPVLLAATVPAQPGQRVLEAGTGAGAALMCLAARVPGVVGVGVEIDPALAALAQSNLDANALGGLTVVSGDLLGLGLSGFDHAFANPPWHSARSTASPNAGRRMAKQAVSGGLDAWIQALVRAVRFGGTITLILPAASAEAALEALAGLGARRLVRLVSKLGGLAKLALVTATNAPPSSPVARAELVLHQANGTYTKAVESILRQATTVEAAIRTASCPDHT